MINFMGENYYTYAYLRLDGTPYYIGRGKGRRAFVKHGNISVPPKERILFLKTNLTFIESCKHECYMIFVLGFKREGGLLHNRTNGGEGSEHHSLTSEQKEKISRANKGKVKTSEHRKKLSESCKGREVDFSVREKISNTFRSMDVHPNGKLTQNQRREIARRFIPRSPGNGYGNASELAAEYGIHRDHINRIARNPRWTS
jgi:hypothetical protein